MAEPSKPRVSIVSIDMGEDDAWGVDIDTWTPVNGTRLHYRLDIDPDALVAQMSSRLDRSSRRQWALGALVLRSWPVGPALSAPPEDSR